MPTTPWRDSLPPPQPIRHRLRARQDFEDSQLADQLALEARAPRRATARTAASRLGQQAPALRSAAVLPAASPVDTPRQALPTRLLKARPARLVVAGAGLMALAWGASVALLMR